MKKFAALKVWYDQNKSNHLVDYLIMEESDNKADIMSKYTPNYTRLGFDAFFNTKEEEDGVISQESDFITYVFDLEAFNKTYNTPCDESESGIKGVRGFENLCDKVVTAVKDMIDNNEITNRYFVIRETIETENKDKLGLFRYDLKEQSDNADELIKLYLICSVSGEEKPVYHYPESNWTIDCVFSNCIIDTSIYLVKSSEELINEFKERYNQFIKELNRSEFLNKI